jgi:hypothetical protein
MRPRLGFQRGEFNVVQNFGDERRFPGQPRERTHINLLDQEHAPEPSGQEAVC